MTEVRLLFAGESIRLLPGAEPVTVPSGTLVLTVTGPTGGAPRLDGRPVRFKPVGNSHVLPIDLSRSGGYHRLTLQSGEYWFATEDAKSKLQGMEAMLRYLDREGFAWSGQLFFSDGSTLRDVNVLYGWLDKNAQRSLDAAAAICKRPRGEITRTAQETATPTRPVDVAATAARVRRDPSRLMTVAANGPVRVAGRRYAPTVSVVRARRTALDTPANQRVGWLLTQIRSISEEVQRISGDPARTRCADWADQASKLLATPLLGAAMKASAPPRSQPSRVERTDERYVITHTAATSLQGQLGWSPTRSVTPLYAFVSHADEIYQAFVAYTVARALRLRPTGTTLTARPLAFESDEWHLYYNVRPPRHVLASWRDFTDSPANYRPDILLAARRSGKVVLADVKYRNKGTTASEDSRREMLSYMAAYGLNRALIFFPPTPPEHLSLSRISSGIRSIAELTVAPTPGLDAFLSSHLLELVEEMATVPRWRLS